MIESLIHVLICFADYKITVKLYLGLDSSSYDWKSNIEMLCILNIRLLYKPIMFKTAANLNSLAVVGATSAASVAKPILEHVTDH